MKTIVALPFDAGSHVAVAVPRHFSASNPSPDTLVVEGKLPDTKWKVNHQVKITFFLEGKGLSRTCKKSERYTYGPISGAPGKKGSHGSRCVSYWILAWLAGGCR